jgi:2-polyprenyl-3-methyl-5-hydroxy-6-metoxy-1,4-benzoquinol methylase
MKEFEIRSKEIFDKYLEISKMDIRKFFSDFGSFVEIPCPACKSKDVRLSFRKYKFSYKICNRCFTLFVSPRPTSQMINDFYRWSDSSKFWAERFFPETAEARRIKIFQPRAKLITELIKRFSFKKPLTLVDIGSGFGIFLEEIRKTKIFDEIIGVEPSVDLAKCCTDKGFKVIDKPVENIKPNELKASIVCSFEVFEHLFNPESYIRAMTRILKPGGIMVFTTLTISGLDLQVLWQNSKSVSPPHHINCFSIEGLRKIVKRCGLKEIEISTPGELDVDIIKNTIKDNPKLKIPRFIEYLIKNRESKTLEQLQDFLKNNQLSSHARIVAQKTK